MELWSELAMVAQSRRFLIGKMWLLNVSKGAMIAVGSAIREDVAKNSLIVERSPAIAQIEGAKNIFKKQTKA